MNHAPFDFAPRSKNRTFYDRFDIPEDEGREYFQECREADEDTEEEQVRESTRGIKEGWV